MDIGSIFLILALLLLVALYISQPLLQRNIIAIREDNHEYSALLAERDRVLNILQELDFDHTLGKIPESVYPSQRAALLQQGAAILRHIDEYHGGNGGDDIDARLEAAINTSQADFGDIQGSAIDDDEMEAMIANRRRTRKERSGGFCPHCGCATQQSDQFCSKCGHSLV